MKKDIVFENELFKAANKLRGKIPPADYKYYVLPLIFIRYLSLIYSIKRVELEDKLRKYNSEPDYNKIIDKLNNPKEYEKEGVLFIPYECSWEYIIKNIDNDNIKLILDDLMSNLENRHNKLKGVLPRIYSQSNISNNIIRDLINLFSSEEITSNEISNIDFLGRIYEYFISNFASTEGNRGGEFFTPSSIVDLLVEMLEPTKGIIYDPACGTGGMFIQSAKYSNCDKITFVGQEQNEKTIKLAKMNSLLHGINPVIKQGDTLLDDKFKDLKADTIISNPPFNMKDWGSEYLEENDPRLIGSVNPNNANYMWIQHFLYHLNDNGTAGFVIANGALTSSAYSDKEVRKKLIDENLIDCVVQLPEKMFFGTAIPSALIFISKNRDGSSEFVNRENNVLFIDASSKGKLINKKHKVFSKSDIKSISNLYLEFKRGNNREYNELGISAIVSKDEVILNDYKLMPSLYTGIEKEKYDEDVVNEKICKLSKVLEEQFKKSIELQIKIMDSLGEIYETK